MHLFHKLASQIGCRTNFNTPQLRSPDTEGFKTDASTLATALRRALLLDISYTDDFINPVVCAVATNLNILQELEPGFRVSELVAHFGMSRDLDTTAPINGGVTVLAANVPPSIVALPPPTYWPDSNTPWVRFRALNSNRLEMTRPDAEPVELRYSTDNTGVVSIDFEEAGIPLNFRARFASEFQLAGCLLHMPWQIFPFELFNTTAITHGAADLLNSAGLLGAYQGAQTQHVTRAGLIGAALIIDYRATNG
jgi:hypothetical protein